MTHKTNARPTAPGINDKPSEHFAYGLTDWTTTRIEELKNPPACGYGYYINSCEEHINALWRAHAGTSAATLAELDGEETPFSFKVTNTSVSAILGGIARQLGWRIVPAAMMAAERSGDGELLARVNDECRAWALKADLIHDGWRAAPRTKVDMEAARLLIRGHVKTALDLVHRLRADPNAQHI